MDTYQANNAYLIYKVQIMNIDKYIVLLKSDIRVTELQTKNVITALYLNESIKEDEKQLRKLENSDRNFDGCIVTGTLIKDLILNIKDKKKELFSLPDNVPVICKQVLNISIITKPKQTNDSLVNFYN